MFVCICWFDLFLSGQPNSLKGKRQVIKSLKDKIWNKFRVSIAEVGKNQLWQRMEMGITFVCSEKSLTDKIYSRILNLLNSYDGVEVVDQFYEIQKIK